MLPLRFHHFGLAARDAERASMFVRLSGYEIGDGVVDPLQRVVLRWCTKPDAPSIEIVSPGDAEGPLSAVLADSPASFYHLCYEIDCSASEALAAMRVGGLRVVTVVSPTPAILFGGRNVSFHIVQGFGLVELLEPERV